MSMADMVGTAGTTIVGNGTGRVSAPCRTGSTRELRSVLRNLIRERAGSVARVERIMGRRRGYVADAIRGKKVLTVDLILHILRAVDVDIIISLTRRPRHPAEARTKTSGGLKVVVS